MRAARKQSDLDRTIDQGIDKFFAWVAKNTARIIVFLVLAGAFVVFGLPNLPVIMQMLPLAISIIFQLLFAIVFIVIQFGAMMYFMSRPRMYWVMPGETGLGFKDYKGNPEVLELAQRIVIILRGTKRFKDMGGEPTRGLLLSGPPGTGKSYLAQCISTEAGVPFGYCSSPSLQSAFMGMGAMTIWRLYRKARKLSMKYGACILFFDEIDAIGMARGNQGPMGMGFGGMMFGGGNQLLNELLMQMDPPPTDRKWSHKLLRKIGIRRKKAAIPPVLTMGATNLVSTLDAALLRPGRFDRHITVDLPSADGRAEIIEYYLAKIKHEDIDIDRVVSDTLGYTPVAIKHIINEGVIHAHFAGRDAVTYEDLTAARETHEWGVRQPLMSMSYEEKRRLAFHEAGHAVAAVKLHRRARVTRATIIRHSDALGLVAWKPTEEIYTKTREEVLEDIDVALASRASEEIFLGTQLTGVTGDLQQATQAAAYLIGMYGMNGSLVSMAVFGGPDGEVRRDVHKLLRERYAFIKRFIEDNRPAVEAVAEALLQRSELDGREVEAIVREASAAEPAAVAAATPLDRQPLGAGTNGALTPTFAPSRNVLDDAGLPGLPDI